MGSGASIFFSESEARLGSLGITPFILGPPLPNILAEWAAILPLVCHLASHRDDYITTGEIALLGRLYVGLFPRLGTLSSIARLLERGTKFLDCASTKGGSGRTVWDVKWGSVFPCANGAASAAISKYLESRDTIPLQRMPEMLPRQSFKIGHERPTRQSSSIPKPVFTSTRGEVNDFVPKTRPVEKGSIRRFQTLRVYRFYYKQRPGTPRRHLNQLWLSRTCRNLRFTLLIAVAVFLSLFGAYGTAAVLLCTSISELVAQCIQIPRPSSYLKNTETHDSCMLVASHQNATEWHLYIGDRAIVDTILNKPMFIVPEGGSAHLAASWFRFAHLLQLAGMTFVAAQKGWDGVCLVTLLVVHWAFYLSLRGRNLASDWLEREGVEVRVQGFEFSGRLSMLGAIQVFSKTKSTGWMDSILAPHPRREAWLGRLRGEEPVDNFDAHDTKWIERAAEASLASGEVLNRIFGATNIDKRSV